MSYLPCGLNQASAGSHMSFIAEGMAISLVSTVIVVAGHKIDDSL